MIKLFPATSLALFSICLCLVSFVTGDVVVDDATAQEKWRLMEYRLKSIVNDGIRTLLPRLMEGQNLLNISSTCMQNGMKIIAGLRMLKPWAFKFLDASSKSIDGLLDGTLASLGSYDECLDNKVIDERVGETQGDVLFQGKYCRVEVRVYLPRKPHMIRFADRLEALENITKKNTVVGEMASTAHLLYSTAIVGGICIPSGCSQHDVNQVLRQAGDYMGTVIKATHCEIKEENKFTPVIIAVIALYSFTLFLVLISTLAEIYLQYRKIEMQDKTRRVLCSFSCITNFRKLTNTSVSMDTFTCLNGMRTITQCWIILCHTYLLTSFEDQSIPRDIDQHLQEFTFQAILNGTFAVDTFFFIGGMLVCYNATKLIKIGKKHFSFTMFVVHRLWRLLPVYIYVIAFVFLYPILGSGPFYHRVKDQNLEACQRNWWSNLLFINNFYDTQNICVGHGWYLSADMQFYLGSLVIILPLMRSAKAGITVAVSLMLAAMIGCAVQVHISDLPAALITSPNTGDQIMLLINLYCKPHYHAGPYIIGILCGYLLAVNPKFKIPKIVQIMGWSLTVVFSFCVVNGIQKWNGGVIPSFWEKIFYSSCNRVAWGLAVAWVVVACSTGHASIVNNILSWKLWVPMARLTFLAYLTHVLVIQVFAGTRRTISRFDHSTAVWQFFGYLVPTYLIAFAGSILVEMPFLSLQKIVFQTGRHEMPSEDNKKQKIISENLPSPVNDDTSVFVNGKNPKSEEKCGITNTGFVHRL